MSGLISAAEARDRVLSQHSKTWDYFLHCLEMAIADDCTEFDFSCCEGSDLTELEIQEIRRKGYNVHWDSNCQYYRVSFLEGDQ